MRPVEASNAGGTLPLDALRSVLGDHPVRVAILFGSHATGRVHARSDVDIAVELGELRPGDSEYNEALFGLGADVSEVLGTDDVDLVDLHTLSSSFARTVFDDGTLLVGESERVETLRHRLTDDTNDWRSPRERFDESLQRIDEHLV